MIHARRRVRVAVQVVERRLRVEPCDDAPGAVQQREAAPDAGGGRGLALVQTLAEGWRVEQLDPGNRVWFEVTAT